MAPKRNEPQKFGSMNRRTLLTTFGTGAVIGLSGCSELRTTADSETDTEDPAESQPATPDPVYRLEVTDLQFDLTELRTSTLDQHDRAHVRRNHAVQPTITLQKDGERIDPDLLSDLTLETGAGTRVETTETGHVPEYAVETGQRLTVRGAVDGEPVRDDIAARKALPESFLIDGKIVDGRGVLYETSWNTPYRFDSHTTEREEFLETRATLRDEMAAERVLERIDTERIRENWRTLRSHDYTERELKGFMLANARASVVGTPSEESVLGIGRHDAIAQAVNEEKNSPGAVLPPVRGGVHRSAQQQAGRLHPTEHQPLQLVAVEGGVRGRGLVSRVRSRRGSRTRE
ncbi:hypothetical protein DU500_07645 [Haloplanus rubicundus]|uniref:Uncharacterized protein n=1 Tax=Haloplanus rubicundus TaxID=1547898 RepID=A0A345E292_9EURY|nr:hypothetical protein [Haloplanus rubicundus]AXG06314.1 hypothetical protein DU500_07645 [Haloplanus rubicundus]